MPELPDLSVYQGALERRIVGRCLDRLRLGNPFVLRTVSPSVDAVSGRRVQSVRRIGKQMVFELAGGLAVVVHLMIAGRFTWKDDPGAPLPKRRGLAAWDFETGTLILTEAGTKRRAAIHLVKGIDDLAAFDRGGLEPLAVGVEAFRERLCSENHTLKRALTDQRMLAGIGNAYSDEILFAAQLSPFKQTRGMNDDEWQRLYRATRKTLETWAHRLAEECGEGFPKKVTAFRDGMAVHGRYRQPCPLCGSPIQRIVYAENEANYCARCQTGGRLLADRALSRLLKSNWPKTIDELE